MQMLRKLDHANVIKVWIDRCLSLSTMISVLFQLLDSFYTPDSRVAVLVFELMLADLGVRSTSASTTRIFSSSLSLEINPLLR